MNEAQTMLSVMSATKLNNSWLGTELRPDQIKVTYNHDAEPQAVSWICDDDDRMRKKAKRCGGTWHVAAGGWVFNDKSTTELFISQITERYPELPMLKLSNNSSKPLEFLRFSRINIGEKDICYVPCPIPNIAKLVRNHDVYKLQSYTKNQQAYLFFGKPDDMDHTVYELTQQGAIDDDDFDFANQWSFESCLNNKLQVEVNGWAVKVTCDLSNPFHYLIAPEAKYRWEGAYPYGVKVAVPWDGTINITRKHWPALKAKIEAAELGWEGDDPEKELAVSTEFNSDLVPGWDSPAPNGHLLHKYQKEGARFCASRGMRALIGDEMGIGKTAQAIAAAEATNAQKVLIICPANARYVWDREIQDWGGRGAINHIMSQTDQLDMNARWHILTYDLIASRAETWRLKDAEEEKAFVDAFPDLVEDIQKPKNGDYPHKVTLEGPLDGMPEFIDPKRIGAWKKMMSRLRGELLEQLINAGPMLVVLDEAHRVKNKLAKRTKAIQRLSVKHEQMLMLTGTPLRNNEHEAAVLLSLLDTGAAAALNKAHGYNMQDIKDYLSYFMIRRTKADVLPQLPAITRQRIDVNNLHAGWMREYQLAIDSARECYQDAINENASFAEVRQKIQGHIERARSTLGLAKVAGGEVADLILDIVENKDCCVVFCAHREVSDDLKKQLENEKMRVAVLDGRTAQKDRAQIVSSFQGGHLDVIIGGINAAGEAITLTRADTVVFVELDWVPAAMQQAECRIHRVGQLSNCQVIQLIARMQAGDNLDDMMVDIIGSKLVRIGEVLGEDTNNIIAGRIQAELHQRLLGNINADTNPTEHYDDLVSDAYELTNDESFLNDDIEVSDDGLSEDCNEISMTFTDTQPKDYVAELPHVSGEQLTLTLTAEAVEALRFIMELGQSKQKSDVISSVLVKRKQDIVNAFTKLDL
jgi:superfamily II DNA or RNA helicase